MADNNYTCKQCNRGFIASRKRSFCKVKCRYRHETLKRNPNARVRSQVQECTCNGCGKVYLPKEANRNKYCSRECAYTNISAWSKLGGYKRERTSNPFTNVWFKVCGHCSRSFVTRYQRKTTCSIECAGASQLKRMRDNYEPVEVSLISCITCGAPFETNKPQAVYCSNECIPKRSSARDRARKFGAIYEIVNVIKVFKRDGWICQICGKNTPQSRRGTLHKNAPELDHRIPFALGGSHTYENVQCSCRECNHKKGGHRIVGQLPLFSA